jgi:osmotically-inducible protein OsmY
MKTETFHGDVIIGVSAYDDYDHELSPLTALSDGEMPRIQCARYPYRAEDEAHAWGADAYQESADRSVPRLHDVSGRPDADVRREVLRALLLDSLVPLSVDAYVSDGIVTLTGTVTSERERKDAMYLAACVPGVIGVLEELAYLPRPRADDDEAIREAVMAALACNSISDVADLTVSISGWGRVTLSGAVQSGGDRDLAIATALSVADVQVVDDCIQVEN